jgi:hypothetical protein
MVYSIDPHASILIWHRYNEKLFRLCYYSSLNNFSYGATSIDRSKLKNLAFEIFGAKQGLGTDHACSINLWFFLKQKDWIVNANMLDRKFKHYRSILKTNSILQNISAKIGALGRSMFSTITKFNKIKNIES